GARGPMGEGVMATRVLAVVQAWLGSTRLRRKALLKIAGREMVSHVIARARAIPHLNDIVLATTHSREDDALVDLAQREGIACVRGSADDVLDRFRMTVEKYPADAILRVTADCPLLDPGVSRLVIERYLDARAALDYVSNVDPPTYPDGLDTEVFSVEALERAWREARLPSDREHVTTYMRDDAHGFRRDNVRLSENLSHHRWTVDDQRDLDFVCAVYDALSPDGTRIFGMT